MRIGSLFSGAGGLDRAVEHVFGGETVWHAEIDKAASKVLAYRWPGVPNLGDITQVDWATVPPVDILCGGYPCQPFSAAGKRAGTEDGRHMWPYVVEAMSSLRPANAVFENVAGHLTLGFDEVLRDLTLLDYKLDWCMVRASDVGAPHQRARLFLLAEDMRNGQLCGGIDRRRGLHRRAGVWRVVPGSTEDRYDRQGFVCASADGEGLRRENLLRVEGERSGAAGCLCVGADGCSGVGNDSEGSAVSDGEGHCCGYRLGLSSDGGRISTPCERKGKVDGGYAGEGRTVCGEDSGSESAGTGPCPSCGTDCGGVSSRGVVGAGRWVVRADSVRGPVSETWADGERAGLRVDAAVRSDGHVALLPTPKAHDGVFGTPRTSGRPIEKSTHLQTIVSLLPTPCARDFKDGTASPGAVARNTPSLGAVEYYLPTPQAHDSQGPKTPEQIAAMRAKGAGVRNLNETAVHELLPTPVATDGIGGPRTTVRSGRGEVGHSLKDFASIHGDQLLPTPSLSDTKTPQQADKRQLGGHQVNLADAAITQTQWGKYEPAIRRWERLTRPAPAPTEPNKNGNPRLAAAFSEWLMGWPEGWVTDPAIGISRNDQLRIAGNGVVPAQAAAALRYLLAVATNTHTHTPRVPDVTDLMPTPRATDGTKGGPNQRGSSGDLMLPSAVIHELGQDNT